MMRKLLVYLCIVPYMVFAQNQPFISFISPTNTQVGETISISGSNLSNIDRIYFGGVSVTAPDINVISDNLIEATVPAGATRSSIIVRSSNNLIAESSQQFFVSFSGEGSSSWRNEFLESIAPKTDVYDICLCDLNTDGLNDIILTHNVGTEGGDQLTIFQNTSSFGTESFTDIDAPNSENPFGFISTTCADLDGDGKPEAIFTSDGNSNRQLFIYRNISAANVLLSPILNFSLPTDGNGEIRITRRIKVADINGDGKADLVVGNETDNSIHIYLNSSSLGSFSFEDPVEILVGGASITGAFDVGDLDNDGKKDLAIIPFNASNEYIYILRNESLLDDIGFATQEGIINTNRRRNIIIADFNNDGLNDIATSTDLVTSSVGDESIEVFPNSTSASNITFGDEVVLSVPSNLPWGLDAADLNGDGFLDIATATIGSGGSSATPGGVYIFENSTNNGVISFSNWKPIPMPEISRLEISMATQSQILPTVTMLPGKPKEILEFGSMKHALTHPYLLKTLPSVQTKTLHCLQQTAPKAHTIGPLRLVLVRSFRNLEMKLLLIFRPQMQP
ncbi:MAG: VCBS repeat-containing protein [Ekhidna sp.]|nr:VCBS repeat-containing protein [Ekhidna sp.]